MKTLLAAVAVLALTVAHAAAQEERPAGLAGLTMNEWQGCGYVQLALGQMSGADASECAEIKAKLNGNAGACYGLVVQAYMRDHGNVMPPREVRSLGMFGCAMLVVDIPEARAREAAKATIK